MPFIMLAFVLFLYHFGSRRFLKASSWAFITLFFSGCSGTNFFSGSQNLPWYIISEQDPSYNSPIRKWQDDIEEDGLPAQRPPSTRIRSLPDDPSQPWSLNYGKEQGDEISSREAL